MDTILVRVLKNRVTNDENRDISNMRRALMTHFNLSSEQSEAYSEHMKVIPINSLNITYLSIALKIYAVHLANLRDKKITKPLLDSIIQKDYDISVFAKKNPLFKVTIVRYIDYIAKRIKENPLELRGRDFIMDDF